MLELDVGRRRGPETGFAAIDHFLGPGQLSDPPPRSGKRGIDARCRLGRVLGEDTGPQGHGLHEIISRRCALGSLDRGQIAG